MVIIIFEDRITTSKDDRLKKCSNSDYSSIMQRFEKSVRHNTTVPSYSVRNAILDNEIGMKTTDGKFKQISI